MSAKVARETLDIYTGVSSDEGENMFDKYGNKILAKVNGWEIIAGEFCFCMTKGNKTLHHKGSLEGAKSLAAATN